MMGQGISIRLVAAAALVRNFPQMAVTADVEGVTRDGWGAEDGLAEFDGADHLALFAP